jgi:predicted permease
MPDWNEIVRARICALDLGGAGETDLVQELAGHLEDRYRELCAVGDAETEAFRKTVAELDDLAALRSEARLRPRARKDDLAPGATTRANAIGEALRDLRYVCRAMKKNPLAVLLVVGTLAVGIGGNTTVFTAVNTLLLNPLPVHHLSELVAIAAQDTAKTSNSNTLFPLSYSDLKDYRDRSVVFNAFAMYTSVRTVTWQEGQEPQRIFAEVVSDDYFGTLGIAPARGRFFSARDKALQTDAVAVMSYGAWQRRFGQSNVIGKTLRINNVVLTIIGVAPEKFIGVNALFGPDLWIPAEMAERVFPGEMQNALTDRNKGLFMGLGRLRPGIKRARAESDISTIASALSREYPASDEGRTGVVRPVSDVVFGGGASSSALFAGIALLIVAAIVLVIACSNVANLLLARSTARRHEFAVRVAIGASRARIIRQLLTESLFLALVSGAVGWFVSYGGIRAIFGTLPSAANFVQPRVGATVFLYSLLVSLATGFLFGTLPALKVSRTGVADALKEESRASGRSRRRVTMGGALLVGQVSLSFLLLMTAALFLRATDRAYSLDPGFQTVHLAVFMTNPGQSGYSAARTKAFYDRVRDEVSRMPEIESVSWASNLPLWSRTVTGLEVEGREQRSRSDRIRSVLNTVDRGFFETAGIPLVAGRGFTIMDGETSSRIAIVNAAMAQTYWPKGALGRRIRLPGERSPREIVGTVRTANYTGWGEAPQNCVYVPLAQNFSEAMILYVRTRGDPKDVLLEIQRAVHAIGPDIAMDIRTGPEIVNGGLFQMKVAVGMLGVFGLLALALASIGLYGMVAYSVSQRTREIGLRMALGATRQAVLGLVLREGMRLVGLGMAIGFAVAVFAGAVLRGLLYGVAATDPSSVIAASAAMLGFALIACLVPARSATRVDPMEALRES